MTGVIVQLSADRSCGTIMGEDGVSVRFDLKSVLAHDIISLEAGKPVHFEIAPHHRHRAISVCIRPRVRVAGREGVSHLHSVRYLGFEQAAGVRAYEFRRTSPCESPLTLVVTTEVALFARHRVALQEGPALCLTLVNAELARTDANAARLTQWSLGDKEMLAYLDSRPDPVRNRSHRSGVGPVRKS